MTVEIRYDEYAVSDLHKDAYGFRPTEYFWTNWEQSSDEQRNQIWDDLLRALKQSVEAEAERDKLAIQKYELMIANAMSAGADSRETAIRWVVQSLQVDVWDLTFGGDAICYKLGLPFRMASEFNDAVDEILAQHKEAA